MEVILCLVVAISDGDTLKVRCHDAEQSTVRIEKIDAPEKGQPWGERSRQALAALCFRQSAELRPAGRDRYGRMLASVSCGGVDAGSEQVRAGLAWAYRAYRPGAGLLQLEEEARAARRGLWADPKPVPPWEWRAKKKPAEAGFGAEP